MASNDLYPVKLIIGKNLILDPVLMPLNIIVNLLTLVNNCQQHL